MAGSRPCSRRSMAASSPDAAIPVHMATLAEHAIEHHRSGRGQSLPLRRDRCRRCRFRDLRREHRYRRAGDDQGRGEEPRRCGHRHRARRLRDDRRGTRCRRAAVPSCGASWHARPLRTRRAMTRRSPTGSPATRCPTRCWSRHRSSKTLRYGENPHQAAALYRWPQGRPGVASGPAAAGQGALLQQPAGCRRGTRAGGIVRAAGRGHHQAHQSLRRRPCRSLCPTPGRRRWRPIR